MHNRFEVLAYPYLLINTDNDLGQKVCYQRPKDEISLATVNPMIDLGSWLLF